MKTNNIEKKILSYLKSVRFKMLVENFIRLFFVHSSIFLAIVFFILIITKFAYFPTYNIWIFRLFIISIATLLGHFILIFPSKTKVIKTADDLFFKQRLITAIELDGVDTEVANLQRQDSINEMKSINVAKEYRIKFNEKLIYPLALVVVLIIASTFINTATYSKNRVGAEEIKEIQVEAEKLEKNIEEELEKAGLDKEAIEEILDKMDKNLKLSKDKTEALKALSIAKNELIEQEQEPSSRPSQQTSSSRASETSRGTSQIQDIQIALKEINEAGKKLAGESISDYAFEEKQSTVISTEVSDSERSGETLQTTSGENSQSDSERNGETSQNGQTSQSQGKSANGQANQGEGQESNSNASQGSGQGQKGQGQSQTSSQGGQGDMQGSKGKPGNKSSNEDLGYQEETATLDSKGNSEYKREIYEALYDPNRLGGKSEPEYLSGEKSNDNDKSYKKAQTMPSEAGEFIDYKELYAKYGENAVYEADDMEIPSGMKTVVKEYFENLNE